MNLSIRRSDRACFFGRTGSGKTTLARALLRNSAFPYVVLDPKHRYRDEHDGFEIPIVDRFDKRRPQQIIRVDPGANELVEWDEAIYDVWRAGDHILYVDEATLVLPGPRTILPELGRAIRTGRERNVGVWIGSQRPKELPSVVFTEAEHFLLFRLQFEPDIVKVCEFTSPAVWPKYMEIKRAGRSRKHDFLYYNVDDDRLVSVRATRQPGAAPAGAPAPA